MNIHINLTITGRVQGVGYRAGAFHKAKELRLQGWVMNYPDGSVHIAVEGPESTVQEFIAWCYEGPMLAKVSEVTSHRGDVEGFTTFEILK